MITLRRLSTRLGRTMAVLLILKRFIEHNQFQYFHQDNLNIYHQVKAMVQGRDRRPELGYKMAVECRKMISYPAKNKNSRYNNIPEN